MRRVPGKQVCAALDPLPHVLSIGVVGRCVCRADHFVIVSATRIKCGRWKSSHCHPPWGRHRVDGSRHLQATDGRIYGAPGPISFDPS